MQAAAACVTVNDCPPIVAVPVRWIVAVLASIEMPTLPFPDPVEPEVTRIQAALLVATHVQLFAVVTATVVDSPAAPACIDVGDSVCAQVIAACVTVNGRPAIVSVAVRELVVVFAAALNATDPFPLPDAPDVIVTQAAALLAVHVQFEPEVTFTLPLAPAATTDALDADSV